MWTETRRVAGVELVERGDPDAPAVVLIPDLGTSSYLWRNVIPLLFLSTHVLAPELDVGASVRDNAARLRGALAELDVGTAAVVGHGFGGGVAQVVASDGDVRVEALGLIGSLAFDERPRWPDATDAETFVRALLETGVSRRERLTGADVDAFVEGARGRSTPRTEHEALEVELADLDIPALVVWGEDDRIVDPAIAERLGEALPRAAVALLPGCGHFVLEDAAETVAPLLAQWLRSQYLHLEHRHETGPVTVELGRRPAGEER